MACEGGGLPVALDKRPHNLFCSGAKEERSRVAGGSVLMRAVKQIGW